VQEVCHGDGDKLQRIRRIAGQLVELRSTYGSYPPAVGLENAVSSDSPVFDALPVG
jgi:hypothetical protein